MFWLKRKFVRGADVDVPLSGIQSVVAVNIKLQGGGHCHIVTAVTRDPSHTYIVTRAVNEPSRSFTVPGEGPYTKDLC